MAGSESLFEKTDFFVWENDFLLADTGWVAMLKM